METSDALKLISDSEFLNKIYRFSYNRCNTSFDAEDLCSDIVLEIISAVHKQQYIDNFYAFAWKIARRVYADSVSRSSRDIQTVSIENADMSIDTYESANEIDNFIEKAEDAEQIRRIFEKISFLSKAYRDVMILYYIDGISINGIASRLGISENAVKQRLFSARRIIRKEVNKMDNKDLSLRPIYKWYIGTGNPVGNNPAEIAERSLSAKVIYLCKNRAKSAHEISDELLVPAQYIEEELEMQCRGINGEYGMLRKLENGKYLSNVHVVDYEEYKEVNAINKKYITEICDNWAKVFEEQKDKILSYPYLSPQDDVRFIFWALINNCVWNFRERVEKIIAEKYFTGITTVSRPYSVTMVAHTGDTPFDVSAYGCDSIESKLMFGYKDVKISNLYGNRIDAHFHCGTNLGEDARVLMTFRSIGGLDVDTLTEFEKDAAANAIECGYIKKIGYILVPKIVVIDNARADEFYGFAKAFNENLSGIAENIAGEVADYARKHIPEHLMNEYNIYTRLIADGTALSDMIEASIERGLLTEPESRIGAEGVVLCVGKKCTEE